MISTDAGNMTRSVERSHDDKHMQAFPREWDTDSGGEFMTDKRMHEATINSSLDAYLHGAKEGDADQARRLHEMLDLMLTEREIPDGQLWLTDHGKMLLADMHRQLSQCGGSGGHLRDTVLDAVQFKPYQGHWQDTCSYLHDLRIATTVANELCEQRDAGREPNVTQAAKAVADHGEFGLDSSRICEIYDEIALTLGGFREISSC
jgi:hypothetical protein